MCWYGRVLLTECNVFFHIQTMACTYMSLRTQEIKNQSPANSWIDLNVPVHAFSDESPGLYCDAVRI